jgi:hypothetical protein
LRLQVITGRHSINFAKIDSENRTLAKPCNSQRIAAIECLFAIGANFCELFAYDRLRKAVSNKRLILTGPYMKTCGSKFLWQSLRTTCVVAGVTMAAPTGHAETGPFSGLEGPWSGGGTVQVGEGATERIRCRATYVVASDGNNLHQALRCASDSYRFDLNSNVISRGGNLTGTWSESSRNINGGVEGQASNGQFTALVTANGFSATLSMATRGSKQTIVINSQNAQLRAVQIALTR